MEDTALGSSAYVRDPVHQTDQWKFQHYTDGGMVHSQADQHELIRVEPSGGLDKPRARGCKDKLSEAQKREKKRQCDVKYRLKKKIKVNEMTAQNESLQEQIGWLSTENRHLKEETGRLTAENKHLEELIREVESKGTLPAEVPLQRKSNPVPQSTSQEIIAQNKSLQEEIVQLSTENKHLKEETGRLTIENRHLKDKAGRLTTENRHLEEHIRELQSRGKRPAEVLLKRKASDISQSTSLLKRDNVQILTSINFTTQHYLNVEAENSVLRAELMELRERLQFLQAVIAICSEIHGGAFDAEDTSLIFIEPTDSDNFLNPQSLMYLNEPILASADLVQY
ncbi:hypothetical protein DITRI_Ditri07aG0018100 [Diplodiscus trichospermus]